MNTPIQALQKIAGFTASQFNGTYGMALECVSVARAALDEYAINMTLESRASLRHFLSAAILFQGPGLSAEQFEHCEDIRKKTLHAFDEWFRYADLKAARAQQDVAVQCGTTPSPGNIG